MEGKRLSGWSVESGRDGIRVRLGGSSDEVRVGARGEMDMKLEVEVEVSRHEIGQSSGTREECMVKLSLLGVTVKLAKPAKVARMSESWRTTRGWTENWCFKGVSFVLCRV